MTSLVITNVIYTHVVLLGGPLGFITSRFCTYRPWGVCLMLSTSWAEHSCDDPTLSVSCFLTDAISRAGKLTLRNSMHIKIGIFCMKRTSCLPCERKKNKKISQGNSEKIVERCSKHLGQFFNFIFLQEYTIAGAENVQVKGRQRPVCASSNQKADARVKPRKVPKIVTVRTAPSPFSHESRPVLCKGSCYIYD